MSFLSPIEAGRPSHPGGFTLVELLVATTVFTLILLIGMSVLGQVSNTWRQSVGTVEAFQSARNGFDLLTRNLSQATLNTYLDYVDSNNCFPSSPTYNQRPVRYARQSDLHFVCGLSGTNGMPGTPQTGAAIFFQCPLGHATRSDLIGLDSALCACGYFVEYGKDNSQPEHVRNSGTPAKYRYRLKQLLVPTEDNRIFVPVPSNPYVWFTTFSQTKSYPVSENVIALILSAQDPEEPQTSDPAKLGTRYAYDSRTNANSDPQPVTANQLPPIIQATMVAIDENSALRMGNTASEPSQIRTALAGKFEDPKNLTTDLDSLVDRLNEAGFNHRVFSSAIPIRESRWSKN